MLIAKFVAGCADRRVIAGHQRLIAAGRAGPTTVPVILVDLAEEDARLLIDLRETADRDLTLRGFAEVDLRDLLTRFDQREKRDRPARFDLDEALAAYDREATGIAPGAGWRLGTHRIFCGDATDAAFVAGCLGGTPADLVVTDPPYNPNLGAHGGRAAEALVRRLLNDAMPAEAWEAFCRAWAVSLTANVDGAMYIFMGSREWPVVCRALAEAGAYWSDAIIWAKDRFVLGRADYQRQYEVLWYGSPAAARRQWYGGRDERDVWQIPRPSASPLHPTQKPLELVERAIENSSQSGDTVLDPFCGSGTTLMACERTARHGVGIEIDPRYVAATIARWEGFSGEAAVPLEPKEVTDVSSSRLSGAQPEPPTLPGTGPAHG